MSRLVRAWQIVNDTLYAVVGERFVSVSPEFTVTELGTLHTSAGPVQMDYNQFALAIADGTYGYRYDGEIWADIAAFTGGKGMTFLDGFLLSGGIGDEGQEYFCYASGVYDSETWDGLAFSSVESSPDKLLLPVALKDACIMYGESSIEIWNYNGDGSTFPFSFLPGTAVRYGLAAVQSIASFMGSKAALLRAGNQLLVGVMQGYEVVSLNQKQPDVAAEWQRYETVADAVATSYTVGVHNVYQISFPTANKTWAYESNTGIWVELSTDSGRFKGELAIAWNGKTYMSDYNDGSVFILDEDAVMDDDQPVETMLISGIIKGYSGFHVVPKLFIDMEVGRTPFLPDSPGYDPKITIYLSSDGGNTYKPAHTIRLGRQGEYQTRVSVRRLGRTKDTVIKLQGAGLGENMTVRHVILSSSEVEIE